MIIETLHEISRIMARVQWLDQQILWLRSGTERTTSVLRKTPRGTAEAYRLEAQLDEISIHERDFSTQLVEAMRLITMVDHLLRQLPGVHETIIRRRYCEAMRWEDVAAATHYNKWHCQKLHREALKILLRIEQHATQCHS